MNKDFEEYYKIYENFRLKSPIQFIKTFLLGKYAIIKIKNYWYCGEIDKKFDESTNKIKLYFVTLGLDCKKLGRCSIRKYFKEIDEKNIQLIDYYIEGTSFTFELKDMEEIDIMPHSIFKKLMDRAKNMKDNLNKL